MPQDLITQLDHAMQQRNAAPAQTIGLAGLIQGARTALGGHQHFAAGMDVPTGLSRSEPAVVGTFRLSATHPAPSGDLARSLDLASTARNAGDIHTMQASVMSASRVLQAGAKLIPIADAPEPVQNSSGVVALYRRPSRFEVVTAPAFSVVADEADATVSALPLTSAEINLGESASHAIAWKISRRDQKDRDAADLEFIVARALMLGLARACDSVVLGAMVAASPGSFTLAKAATHGLRFAELSAIAGKLATGAAVGADGVLRCNGVPAELVDVVDASVIAAWTRVAVAVNEEIRAVVKRTSTAGDLEIVAYVNIEAVLPDSGAFWLAA